VSLTHLFIRALVIKPAPYLLPVTFLKKCS